MRNTLFYRFQNTPWGDFILSPILGEARQRMSMNRGSEKKGEIRGERVKLTLLFGFQNTPWDSYGY
jgi:hypothetical protein